MFVKEDPDRKKIIYNKVNKTIGLLHKGHNSFIILYKSYIRPNPDYGDIIYDQTHAASFHQNIEPVQYNSALAITGAMRGTSKDKLYQELGLETIEKREWYMKLCCFFKIFRNQSPKYLFDIILIL